MKFTKLLLLAIVSQFTVCDYKMLFAQKVQWVVFDFDGTLADTLPLTMEFINKSCAELGCNPIKTEAFRENKISKIITDHLGWWKILSAPLFVSQLSSQCMDFFKENRDRITIFSGAKELLEVLSTKYRLAIITPCEKEIVTQTLDKYGISRLFEGVYSDGFSLIWGIDVTIKKFLVDHKLNPDEVLYVGDQDTDIFACKKVGVKIISSTWGYNSRAFLEQATPDYLADSFDELALTIASLDNA
ncbi:MAG: HAD hydrolase-like protein [bacterium]